MKILIVSRSFFPEISPRSFRTTELVKELYRQGHEVVFYTFKNDDYHLEFENKYNVTIKDLGQLRLKSVPLDGYRGISYLLRRIISRVLLMLFEYPMIELLWKVSSALKSEKDYHLLISIAVPFPVHWGVAKARNKKNPIAKVWVADCGDPYMGDTNDSFRKLFYFKYVEKWFCRKADYISVPRIEMKINYYSEFHHKIIEIPQGFNFEELKFNQKRLTKNVVPTFAFAGGFFKGKRDPSAFMQFLCSVDSAFKFIVYTETPSMILPFKEKLGKKMEIRKYIPREELLPILNTMDFLINIGYDPAVQSPSKLIDYHLSGRPVLSFNSDFNEADRLHFNEFLVKDYKNQLIFKDMDKFNISNVARQFVELK